MPRGYIPLYQDIPDIMGLRGSGSDTGYTIGFSELAAWAQS